MTLKLELWVEGSTDAVTHGRWEEAEQGVKPTGAAGGALIPLVRGALASTPPLTCETLEEILPEKRMVAHRLPRKLRDVVGLGGRRRDVQISNHAWKVLAAIDKARSADPDTLVLAVWDRDGNEEPLRDRDGLHELLRRRGEQGVAIAICVEEVEAWLLGDPAAFRKCFGRGLKTGLSGAPEAEPRPKEKLHTILGELGVEREDFPVLYRELAEKVDLDTLTRSCPRGFGELRKALRELVVPCLVSGLRDP